MPTFQWQLVLSKSEEAPIWLKNPYSDNISGKCCIISGNLYWKKINKNEHLKLIKYNNNKNINKMNSNIAHIEQLTHNPTLKHIPA